MSARLGFAGKRLLMLAFTFSSVGFIYPVGQTSPTVLENIDSRWWPWIGSWRLMSDSSQETEGDSGRDLVVQIRPGADGKSVIMKICRDNKAPVEERLEVGSRQTLKEHGCTGWYQYSWSDTGKRLIFESECMCPGRPSRFVSGMSVITENRDWLDIQLIRSGEQRAIGIRRYRPETDDLSSTEKTPTTPIGTLHYPAATGLSIDEIIELSGKVAPEVIQAALVELNHRFDINSRVLQRLADAKVPSQVIDLMVALSLPDKFVVKSHGIASVKQKRPNREQKVIFDVHTCLPFGYWFIYDPFFVPYRSPYLSYGYWYLGWDVRPAGHGSTMSSSGGRLINGRGYSKIDASTSKPYRHYTRAHGESRDSYRGNQNPSSPAHSSKSESTFSRTGSAHVSSSSYSSASPSGYHSSGSNQGRARARE